MGTRKEPSESPTSIVYGTFSRGSQSNGGIAAQGELSYEVMFETPFAPDM